MVNLENIVISLAIEAHEERDVATIDIPSAYSHTYSDEELVMILIVRLAQLLVNIDPKIYRKIYVIEKG